MSYFKAVFGAPRVGLVANADAGEIVKYVRYFLFFGG